jgi:hypothetical protein
VQRDIFVPVAPGETEQIIFQYSSQGESAIGSSGNPSQPVRFHENDQIGAEYKTLHHEMGHCLGLGHEQFHSQFPLRAAFLTVLADSGDVREENTLANLRSQDWEDLGAYDAASIMMYSLDSMVLPGRVELTETVDQPTVLQGAAPPVAPPGATRTRSSSAPSKPALSDGTLLPTRVQIPKNMFPRGLKLSAGDIAAIQQLVPTA